MCIHIDMAPTMKSPTYRTLKAAVNVNECTFHHMAKHSLNDQEDSRPAWFIPTLDSLPLEQPKTTTKSDSDCLISDDCIRIANLHDRQSINVFQNTHRIFEGRDVRRGTWFSLF